VPFLEAREINHFLRVEPDEWAKALAVLDARETRNDTPRWRRPSRSSSVPDGERVATSAMIASLAAEGSDQARPFGHALAAAREERPEIVGLTPISRSTPICTSSRGHPDRFYQMGMAEQLLMAAAAGLAREGFHCPSPPPTPSSPRAAPTTSSAMAIAEENLPSRSSARCRA
jgi:transketolase